MKPNRIFKFKNWRSFTVKLIRAGGGDAQIITMFRDNLNRSGNFEKRMKRVEKCCAALNYPGALCVFKWRDSPEGLDFWKEIYKTLGVLK